MSDLTVRNLADVVSRMKRQGGASITPNIAVFAEIGRRMGRVLTIPAMHAGFDATLRNAMEGEYWRRRLLLVLRARCGK